MKKHVCILITIIFVVQIAACSIHEDESDISSNITPDISETITSGIIDESCNGNDSINDSDESSNTSHDESSNTSHDESSNTSYIDESIQVDSSEYSITAIRTDPLRKDGIFPYCNIVNTEDELYDYYASIRELYSIENEEQNEDRCFAFIKNHTSNWFENNSLIIIVTQGYPVSPPEEASISICGKTMTIVLFDAENDDRSIYHIFIEISSDYIEGIEYSNVILQYK